MVLYYLAFLCVAAAVNNLLLYRVNPKQSGPYPILFFCALVACTGHLLLALSTNVDQAILSNKINYMGAIFLPLLTFDASLAVCNIRLPSWGHALLMLVVFLVYGLSATVGYNDYYYKTVEFVQTYGIGNYVATYGWGHDVFNIMMISFGVANIGLIAFAFAKRKNVSFKSLCALSLIEFASILSLFISRILDGDTLVMPAVYVFDQYALLYICYRVKRYDINQTVSQALESQNADGFILVTTSRHFLGCNAMAYSFFPNLKDCRIDHVIPDNAKINNFLISWINEIHKGKMNPEKKLENNGRHYKLVLSLQPLSHREKMILIRVEDDTNLHNYINTLGTNNVRLELMLKENDSQIRVIQEQMLIGMAHMVENRDSNTGSHIKRTSKVVSILVEYLRKCDEFDYSDFFFDSLVSAAPMHDIGKIAIDDRILRKPGRFTPQEYEEMKSHPEKGAMIVENLLTSIESPEFVKIARNVARYHHERYDGFGYPKKLKGTDIPFEARVMAIADVYDALVSKRCYKAEMSFEEAYSIIIEGMGTQFDPALKECFIACREKLEEYYSGLKENEV